MHTTASKTTRTIFEPPSYAYRGGMKKAVDIAGHYGFSLVPPIKTETEDRDYAKRHRCPEHYPTLIRSALHCPIENGAARIVHTRKVPYKNRFELRLEIIGDKESSAEGLLLRAAQSILQEYGHDDIVARVNSVGGRDSLAAFAQSTTAYFRSRLGDLEPSCREAFKESPFAPLRCAHPACAEARHDAPQALNFLTEQSKQHFREVLEYLEGFDIPYVVDPFFVGNEHYATRTIMALSSGNDEVSTDETLLGFGERYDQLSKKMGGKRLVPAINVTLFLDTHATEEQYKEQRTSASPSAYIVHVGLPAKIETLRLHESLRAAKINVRTLFHKTCVSEQVDYARSSDIPLIVIIGQKEAVDHVAVVRHVYDNRQDSVPFTELPAYLLRFRRA